MVFFLRIVRILRLMIPRVFCMEVRRQPSWRLVCSCHVVCVSRIHLDQYSLRLHLVSVGPEEPTYSGQESMVTVTSCPLTQMQ